MEEQRRKNLTKYQTMLITDVSFSSGAFLIPYFISLVLLGIPLLFLELAIGQSIRLGTIGVWKAIHPYLGGVGLASAVVCVLVSMYYNMIIAWCFYYLFASFQDPLPYSFCPDGPNCTTNEVCKLAGRTQYYWYTKTLVATTSIENMGDFQWHLCLLLLLAWIVLLIVISRGVKSAGKVKVFKRNTGGTQSPTGSAEGEGLVWV